MSQERVIPELTAEELVRRVESGEEIRILDVRAPMRLAAGRIDIVPDAWFVNVRGSEVLAMEDPAQAGLEREVPVAVVCGRGMDSAVIADHLNERGFRSASLEGGMIAWMALSVPRELEPPSGAERLVQFDRIGKGALGYVLISAGEALVVDPPRNTEPYRNVVREAGARIVAVADTHVHADYVSGGPALARELGVPYRIHPADSFYPYDGTPGRIEFEPIEEGGEIPVGRVRLRAEHTPGHTEGSLSFRLGDDLVLSGDFVFVDSVGRPDLGDRTDEWTKVLWRSLERARAEWPARMWVYPAHYASVAERNGNRSVGAPFGGLPARNAPLAMRTEEEFTSWILSKAGTFPEAYRRIKAVNVGLESPREGELDELEAGRNQCALG